MRVIWSKYIDNRILPYIILLIAGVTIYYPILGNQLLDFWDDQWSNESLYRGRS